MTKHEEGMRKRLGLFFRFLCRFLVRLLVAQLFALPSNELLNHSLIVGKRQEVILLPWRNNKGRGMSLLSLEGLAFDNPKKAVFEAARRGDAVFLDQFLETFCCTEITSVLAVDDYIDYYTGRAWLGRDRFGNQVDRPDKLKTTPLIVAVQNGNLDCVKILLKYKAEIEGRGDFVYAENEIFYRCTPLFVAAANGIVDILSFLVESGADINAWSVASDFTQFTPLMIACENEELDAVIYLIDQGAEVNLQNNFGETALHKASAVSNNNYTLSCLINSGANVNACTYEYEKCTPLILACETGNSVNCFLQNGANVDFQNNHGKTALHYAVWSYVHCNSFDNLSALISYGADINTTDLHKRTPLMVASKYCGVKEVTLLIEHGAKVDLQDRNGDTALHYAGRGLKNMSANFRRLLTAGASFLCKNSQGLTPLLEASKTGNIEIVECLIKQPEITKEQRIDALELLGSSLSLDYEVDVENGFKYIKRGMLERFADPTHPLLKKQMEPVEAYQNRKESQTLEELAQVEDDKDAIIMESLVVRERVFGRNNVQLLEPIRLAADYYEHNSDFSTCIGLYRHAMQIAQCCNLPLGLAMARDLDHITSLLQSWLDSDLPKDEVFTELLDQTVLDHHNDIQRKLTKQKQQQDMFVGIEQRQDQFLFDSLFRVVNMMSQLKCDEEEKLSNAAVLFNSICKLNHQDFNCNTLLHEFVIFHCNIPLHSYTGAMKLLLNAGFNVNAANDIGNTPLHLAVTFTPWDDGDICFLTDMLQVLFDGGAHHDFVNNDGKTPMNMAKTDEARMILMKRRKLELKCITARAVKKFRIPYLGVVPKTLEKYISMH